MADAEPQDHHPFHGHHTAGQRLVLVLNCLIVVLCFAGAVGLLIGKNAGEKGRKVRDQHAVERRGALPAGNSLMSPLHPDKRCRRHRYTRHVPRGRPDGDELPRHRRRQLDRQELRRSAGQGPAQRRTQRHHHGHPARPVDEAFCGAVVSPRPVGQDSRPRHAADQRRVSPRRPVSCSSPPSSRSSTSTSITSSRSTSARSSGS